MTALAHCAMQTDEFGDLSFDLDGKPSGEAHCDGHKQQEVAGFRETITWRFGDFNQGSADPMDQALANNVSSTSERTAE